MAESTQARAADREQDAVIAEVAAALRGLRYGSVEITVHDGRVAQIDRRERRRFVPPREGARAQPEQEHA